MYSITVSQKIRNELIIHLKNKSIDSRLSFPPISTQPYYAKKYNFNNNELINSIYNYNTFLDIPVSVLMDDDDQNRVISEIISFVEQMNDKSSVTLFGANEPLLIAIKNLEKK